MAFTSFKFVVFLAIVFLLYWLVFKRNARSQNVLLLFASITFYCFADWKFFLLLLTSGLVNFLFANLIASRNEGKLRSLFFYAGLSLNVGLLLYFKYFNFFIDSFIKLFNFFGGSGNFTPFHILLPLGISYFTFQMVGYLIDVHHEKIEPTVDVLGFLTYLFYFPKILSGPIERVQHFIPQIQIKRDFNYELVVNGLRQIIWGIFKKTVIADNCTVVVNSIYGNYQNLNGSTLLMGACLFIIIVYSDFSGYSDIACGASKLFGIKITNNFSYPFFSTNISDYWKKWHISLTSWMMDYVFTPLNFTLRSFRKSGLGISIVITFIVVGLWHGANWTFIVFGLLHGLYFLPLVVRGSINKNKIVAAGQLLPSVRETISMIGLFLLVSITAIIVRADNVALAFDYIASIFSWSLFQMPKGIAFSESNLSPFAVLIILGLYILIEWCGRNSEFPIAKVGLSWPRPIRWSLYISIIFFISMYMQTAESPFIYFEF